MPVRKAFWDSRSWSILSARPLDSGSFGALHGVWGWPLNFFFLGHVDFREDSHSLSSVLDFRFPHSVFSST